MKKNKNLTLFLTGGLGNQLFQFTAALARGADIVQIDSVLGKPRLNRNLEPDLNDFILPHNVQSKLKLRKSFFLSKVANYVLRSGIALNNKKYSKIQKYRNNL